MNDTEMLLQEKYNRLEEILSNENWNKDECYEEGTLQDELSWEYSILIDDINDLEELLN